MFGCLDSSLQARSDRAVCLQVVPQDICVQVSNLVVFPGVHTVTQSALDDLLVVCYAGVAIPASGNVLGHHNRVHLLVQQVLVGPFIPQNLDANDPRSWLCCQVVDDLEARDLEEGASLGLPLFCTFLKGLSDVSSSQGQAVKALLKG